MGKSPATPNQWEPDEPTEELPAYYAALEADEEVADEPQTKGANKQPAKKQPATDAVHELAAESPAIDVLGEGAHEPPAEQAEAELKPPCPPHHWLVQDSADPINCSGPVFAVKNNASSPARRSPTVAPGPSAPARRSAAVVRAGVER